MRERRDLIQVRESVRRILLEANSTPIPLDGNNFPGLVGITVPRDKLSEFCKIMFKNLGSTTIEIPGTSKSYGPDEFVEFVANSEAGVNTACLTLLVHNVFNELIPNGIRIKDKNGKTQSYTAQQILYSYKSFRAMLNESIASSSPIRDGYGGLIDIIVILDKQKKKIEAAVSAARSDGKEDVSDVAPGVSLTQADLAEVGLVMAKELAEVAKPLATYSENIAEEFSSLLITGSNIDEIVENIIRAYEDSSKYIPIPGDVPQGVRRVELVIKEAETLSSNKNLTQTVFVGTLGLVALNFYILSKGTLPAKLDRYFDLKKKYSDDVQKASDELLKVMANSPEGARRQADELRAALSALGVNVGPGPTLGGGLSGGARGGARNVGQNVTALLDKWVDASLRAAPDPTRDTAARVAINNATTEWKRANAKYNSITLENLEREVTRNLDVDVPSTIGDRVRLILDKTKLTFSSSYQIPANLSNILDQREKAIANILILTSGISFSKYISTDLQDAEADIASLILSSSLRDSFGSSDTSMLDDLVGMLDELTLKQGSSVYDKYAVTRTRESGEIYKETRGRRNVIGTLYRLISSALESNYSDLEYQIKLLKEAYYAEKQE